MNSTEMGSSRRFTFSIVTLIGLVTFAACLCGLLRLGLKWKEYQASKLVDAWKDRDYKRRELSMGTITDPAIARWAIPSLVALLKDEDPSLRCQAVYALGQIGPLAKDAVPAMVEAMKKDSDIDVPQMTANMIGRIGPAAKAAVPALAEEIQHPRGPYQHQVTLRWWAAVSLARISPPDAKVAVPTLIESMNDPSFRTVAVDALGAIGPEAREALAVLIDALEDQNPWVSRRAAAALSRIDPPTAAAAGVQ